MRIIKISGAKGVGKSVALAVLAEQGERTVIEGSELNAAMPLLLKKMTALNIGTYVDNVDQALLAKIGKLAKLYPSDYVIFVVVTE